jgi:hypothetical protein
VFWLAVIEARRVGAAASRSDLGGRPRRPALCVLKESNILLIMESVSGAVKAPDSPSPIASDTDGSIGPC